MAASGSRSSVSSSRTVTPTMPWPGGRHHRLRVQHDAGPICQAEPLQSGIGQQRGGADAGGQLVEPRLHVAAQRGDGKIRTHMQQLRLATHRGGADQRSRRQAVERPAGSGRAPGPGSARRAHPRASACRPARCPAAARSPGPSGCAPRSRSGRRRAPRGSPWRTAPCRRSRPGGGPAPRRPWCGSRAPRATPDGAAPGSGQR